MKNQIINITAFVALTLLWLAFGAALLFDPKMLDAAWTLFRGWPLIGQAVITLLTLPVAIGLWVWHTAWPIWLRLVIVVGLAWVTLYLFFPKKLPDQAHSSLAHS